MTDPADTAAAPPPAAPAAPSPFMTAAKDFFKALFDFRFATFVTRRIAGVVYGISLIAIALAAVVWFFTMVGSGIIAVVNGQYLGLLIVLLAFIVVPIAVLVAVVVSRVSIELVIAVIKVAENTAVLQAPPSTVKRK